MAPTPTISRTPPSLSQGEQQAFEEIVKAFHASTPEGQQPRPGVEHDLVSQAPQQLAHFQSSESRVMGFFKNVKSKFSSKELFGSVFTFLYIGNQVNNFRMGLANNEMTPQGTLAPAPDLGRMLNSAINAVITSWTFFSTRSAMVPEGKNMLQRMKYSLENLDKCQVQVRDTLALAGGVTSMLEHFMKGFKLSQHLQRHKMAKTGQEFGEIEYDSMRIAQGVLSAIGNCLNVYALFGPEAARKKRIETERHEESAHKLANFELRPFKEATSMPLKGRVMENIKTVARFFKNNPMLMLNSFVSLAMAVALNVEGQRKRHTQAEMFGKVGDFGQTVDVQVGKKKPRSEDASELLFTSLFGIKKFNDKINTLAVQHGIKPEEGTPANFLAAFRGNTQAMKDLNAMIPDGKKALGEAGSRAIKSSVMGIILNMWGLTFRAQQVLREDRVSLGIAR